MKIKKSLAAFLSAAMVVTSAAIPVFAADGDDVSGLRIGNSSKDEETIQEGKPYKVNEAGTAFVSDGASAEDYNLICTSETGEDGVTKYNVELKDAQNITETLNLPANTTLKLLGNNTINAGSSYAISVPDGDLTIQGGNTIAEEEAYDLTLNGTGYGIFQTVMLSSTEQVYVFLRPAQTKL